MRGSNAVMERCPRGAALQQHGARDRVQRVPGRWAPMSLTSSTSVRRRSARAPSRRRPAPNRPAPCAARASLTPVPTQSGHQPCLLLYENRRGSRLGVAGCADRAGALGRTPPPGQCRRGLPRERVARPAIVYVHHALLLQRTRQRFAQLRLVAGRDGQAHHRQLDGVFLKRSMRGSRGGRNSPSTRRCVRRGRAQSASSV